jgi:hypothetical protein
VKLYAIHAPRGGGPESARAARAGFSWAALIFGPLWLLARGLWLALIVYVVLAVGIGALVSQGWLAPGAATLLSALGHLYLGVEGRALAIFARDRAGRELVDVVHAQSALEAEKIYLERALHPGSATALRVPPAAPDVIGLFPEPGR